MKKSIIIVLSLASFSSATFAGGEERVNGSMHKGPLVMNNTRIVNYEDQGRIYFGGDADYVFSAYKGNSYVLTSDQGDRFNVGVHAGYKQPFNNNWFLAGEFGLHWSTLHLNTLPEKLTEQWGVDLSGKPGYAINDRVSLAAIVGYKYSSFSQDNISGSSTYLPGHALVVGAAGEIMATDNFGLGLNYKHDFWFSKPVSNLGANMVGLQANYYF